MQARLPVLLGKSNGAQGSACHSFRQGEDDRAIRISHVPFGSLQIALRGSFIQIVTGRNRPLQTLPALRTPSPVREGKPQRHIERGDVCACLTSRNELLNHIGDLRNPRHHEQAKLARGHCHAPTAQGDVPYLRVVTLGKRRGSSYLEGSGKIHCCSKN